MAVGQAALAPVFDVGAADAVEARLESRELARHASHADAVRDALELHRHYDAAGMGLATPSQLALVWQCSEARATGLLNEAQVLSELPGGLPALDRGLLTVEQSRMLVDTLVGVPDAVRDEVWQRLVPQLERDRATCAARPPARLRELLRRLVLAIDPSSAAERRRRAEKDATVDYGRRDDGLVDLWALGLTGPNARACFEAIAARAGKAGSWDDRSAGKRRLDALVDLLTGRDPLDAGGCGRGQACGCSLGAAVPCGAQVQVLVPLGTALGVSDEPAELVGHGPIEPDLLQQLLLAAPELRAVWLDEHGVPVAVADRVLRPGRGDPNALQRALLDLAPARGRRDRQRCRLPRPAHHRR